MSEDSERLPAGFVRIGYDADEQRYTFRGPDGRVYMSEPGCRYGELWPVGEGQQQSGAESEAHSQVLKKQNKDAVRTMLPFALLIFVFLLLLFKLINRSGGGLANHGNKQVVNCAQGNHPVQIHQGETCWSIAQGYRMGVGELMQLPGNEGLDCDALAVGQPICVPV